MHWLSFITLASGAHITTTWLLAVRRGTLARRRASDIAPLPQQWPFVSVIVPAWREKGTIESCIESLQAVDYPAWEAIIVAGGPDGTFEAARKACADDPRFRIIEQQPRGKNAALNEGFRAARGEVIVLLDADSRVRPGWLRALVVPINEVVSATTGNPFPLRQTPISLGEQMERIAAYEIHCVPTLQGSGSIAIRREIVEKLGGFPEDVVVGVDWDLNARLAVQGVKRAFCPRAIVYTPRPATLREYWKNEIRWRRAHFNSLFRLREYFLRDVPSALTNLYIYALSWFSALFTFVAGMILVAGGSEVKATVLALWAIFVGWILLRRAALAGEVAAYTRDSGWLKLAWVPPLLLLMTLVAIIPATLTWKRSEMHFKGPRHAGP